MFESTSAHREVTAQVEAFLARTIAPNPTNVIAGDRLTQPEIRARVANEMHALVLAQIPTGRAHFVEERELLALRRTGLSEREARQGLGDLARAKLLVVRGTRWSRA